MSAPALTGIYLLISSPNSSTSSSPGQPMTNMSAYYHEALPGEDAAAIIERVITSESLGCQLIAFDEAQAQRFTMRPNIQPDAG